MITLSSNTSISNTEKVLIQGLKTSICWLNDQDILESTYNLSMSYLNIANIASALNQFLIIYYNLPNKCLTE